MAEEAVRDTDVPIKQRSPLDRRVLLTLTWVLTASRPTEARARDEESQY